MFALLNLLKLYRHRLIATGLLVGAIVLMFSVHNRSGLWVAPVRRAVMDVAGAVQSVARLPVDFYLAASNRAERLLHLEEENLTYRQELQVIKPQLAELAELIQENQRLRRLLQMRPDPLFHTLVAQVVGGSASPFVRTFTLKAGERDGVRVDAPVMGAEGLMGRVVQAGRDTTSVLSMLDLNSRIPVLIHRSRVQAVAAGQNDRDLSLEYIPKGADLEVGDLVITSGMGGVFPKGLVVGRIVTVQPEGKGLFQRVMVRPEVDFDRTEEARILVPVPSAATGP